MVENVIQLLLDASPQSATVPTTNGNLALHWAVSSLFRDTTETSAVSETDIRILQRIYRAHPGALLTANLNGHTVSDIVKGCVEDINEVESLLKCFK
jgi:hypothetical protein